MLYIPYALLDEEEKEHRRIIARKWKKANRHKTREYQRKWRNSEKGKPIYLKIKKKYENNNLLRKKAWIIADNNIKVKKPCFKCNRFPTHKHHPNPLRALDVIYFCPLHYKEIHDNLM